LGKQALPRIGSYTSFTPPPVQFNIKKTLFDFCKYIVYLHKQLTITVMATTISQLTVVLPKSDISFFTELIKRNKWKITSTSDKEPVYDTKFVEKIKKAEKEESKSIDFTKYGISI
jgi:hypothetical protein